MLIYFDVYKISSIHVHSTIFHTRTHLHSNELNKKRNSLKYKINMQFGVTVLSKAAEKRTKSVRSSIDILRFIHYFTPIDKY